MIARITGIVIEKFEKGLVIENHGIGYSVFTPAALPLGEQVTLYTHLVIRDDAHELYGFEHPEEKTLFSILISVSGVGPKSALHMLMLCPLSELVRAIRHADAKAISLVPGVGKKTAEKIVIDLKDKLDAFTVSDKKNNSDLAEALLSLGYKEIQIRAIIADVDGAMPIEKQITSALQLLQKK